MAETRRRRIETEDVGDVTVVTFVDKKILDERNMQDIGEQLYSLFDELGRRKILLNLGNVEYLSSVMLQPFIRLHKKADAVDGRLMFCSIDPTVYEVFEMSKLNKFFNIQRDLQSALAYLQ